MIRLGIKGRLRRTLESTNPAESMIDGSCVTVDHDRLRPAVTPSSDPAWRGLEGEGVTELVGQLAGWCEQVGVAVSVSGWDGGSSGA
jgi:hypothetical protein